LFSQLNELEQLMGRQESLARQIAGSSRLRFNIKFLVPGGRSRTPDVDVKMFVDTQVALTRVAKALSRTALEVSGETAATLEVTADEYDGMRMQFEAPDPEQTTRVREFLAETPSVRRS
jgi:hypothetical protein